MIENRKFPRLDLFYDGTIDIPMIRGERIRLPMLVTSVSPEGASVTVFNIPRLPRTGSLVTVRFKADGSSFRLPMSIAWAREKNQRSELGLVILLQRTPASMAERYAKWIVARFKEHGRVPDEGQT